eukprot:COSAG05_NODE_232_length_13313_cov_677.565991_1_plen_172_part_00
MCARQAFPAIAVMAYQVSGEYAMLNAAAQNGASARTDVYIACGCERVRLKRAGWLDYDKAMMEALLAFKRAGADAILVPTRACRNAVLSQRQRRDIHGLLGACFVDLQTYAAPWAAKALLAHGQELEVSPTHTRADHPLRPTGVQLTARVRVRRDLAWLGSKRVANDGPNN